MKSNLLSKRFFGKGGLTLVEIAIVLVIIGLLVGLGASLVGTLTKRAKIQETREIVDAAVQSVITYVANHKCLPGNLTAANVRTLKDAWGKDLLYIAAPELVQGNCVANTNDTCGRTNSTLSVKVCNDVNCSSPVQINTAIAFVIVSGGANFNIQIYNASNEVRVYAPEVNVDNFTGAPDNINRVEGFDDIVKWVALSELRAKAGCEGQPLEIITPQLPVGYVNASYTAEVHAVGGVPFSSGGKYKWCYSGTLPQGLSANPNSNCPTYTQNNSFTLNGTPTQSGTFPITISVMDSQNNTANRTYSLVINQVSSSSSPGPPGAQITFEQHISQFNQTGSGVQVSGNTLQLGLGQGSTAGCFWFPTQQTLQGKTMRAYFKFKFNNVDTHTYSWSYADGFTFAVVQGDMPVTACGWSGGYLGFHNLGYASIAVEIDTYPNGPSFGDPGPNHIAIIKNGTVIHEASTSMGNNPSCTSSDISGCKYITQASGMPNNPTYLEDGKVHSMRVEIHTGCDSNCNNCGGTGDYALILAWIDCMEWYMDRPYYDLPNMPLTKSGNDPTICREECENNQNCKTYIHQQYESYSYCWLKYTTPDRNPNWWCVSQRRCMTGHRDSVCRDLTRNLHPYYTPTVYHCFQLPQSMQQVKFGFTQGTGAATQRVEISDFGIGFY